MKIEISSNSDAQLEGVLASGLRCFNASFSNGSHEKLNVSAWKDSKTIIGGLTGLTYGNWLHVDILWIAPQARGKSLGSMILKAAEKEAIHRNCIGSTLDTYSFQALEFYLKQGYRKFGQLEGYSGKYTRYYLQKNLVG